ncbi:transcription factor GTE1-like [Trifolium pratense]|uniref:transcription factor GTE1-like n=1 Tax=Trifolium pratense TaxID=57577 RepID=UPI001E6950C6|nr:transcription factor GTE1-like [Trifolium pratense]
MAHNSVENLNRYNHIVYGLQEQVHKLEKQIKEVEQFYQSTADALQNGFQSKDEKPPKMPLKRASEEMQNEVMRHFSKILTEITQHKWVWPFLEPVDVKGLGLHDYYQVIKKPMDFSTIRRKIKAKDHSRYKNVREIYEDVRLIFMNAMTYNNEKDDIYVMAKTLLEKFEKKWLNLLPKVDKAESELSKEEADEQLNKKLAQEATYANRATGLSAELSKVETALRNLKSTLISQCRKLSGPEKIILVNGFAQLSEDNLTKALQIIIENDPNFKPTDEIPILDIEAQSDYTLWRLYMLVKQTLDEGKNLITHEDSMEENKHNAKRRKIE